MAQIKATKVQFNDERKMITVFVEEIGSMLDISKLLNKPIITRGSTYYVFESWNLIYCWKKEIKNG